MNLVHKMVEYQMRSTRKGRKAKRPFDKCPRRLWHPLRKIQQRTSLIGHVYLGFSWCGTYIISYHQERVPLTHVGGHGDNGLVYRLTWWWFRPHKRLAKAREDLLFDGLPQPKVQFLSFLQRDVNSIAITCHPRPTRGGPAVQCSTELLYFPDREARGGGIERLRTAMMLQIKFNVHPPFHHTSSPQVATPKNTWVINNGCTVAVVQLLYGSDDGDDDEVDEKGNGDDQSNGAISNEPAVSSKRFRFSTLHADTVAAGTANGSSRTAPQSQPEMMLQNGEDVGRFFELAASLNGRKLPLLRGEGEDAVNRSNTSIGDRSGSSSGGSSSRDGSSSSSSSGSGGGGGGGSSDSSSTRNSETIVVRQVHFNVETFLRHHLLNDSTAHGATEWQLTDFDSLPIAMCELAGTRTREAGGLLVLVRGLVTAADGLSPDGGPPFLLEFVVVVDVGNLVVAKVTEYKRVRSKSRTLNSRDTEAAAVKLRAALPSYRGGRVQHLSNATVFSGRSVKYLRHPTEPVAIIL